MYCKTNSLLKSLYQWKIKKVLLQDQQDFAVLIVLYETTYLYLFQTKNKKKLK